MIPQLIYIALILIGLGIAFAEHGQPKKGKHNAWITVIATIIVLILLFKGGFFDVLINAFYK